MSIQGAEFVRFGGQKSSHSGKRPQTLEPGHRPNLFNHLFSLGSGLEAPSTPGFWQAPEASATLDGALFNKAQIIESFSKDMDTQMWRKAAEHPAEYGHGER